MPVVKALLDRLTKLPDIDLGQEIPEIALTTLALRKGPTWRAVGA